MINDLIDIGRYFLDIGEIFLLIVSWWRVLLIGVLRIIIRGRNADHSLSLSSSWVSVSLVMSSDIAENHLTIHILTEGIKRMEGIGDE